MLYPLIEPLMLLPWYAMIFRPCAYSGAVAVTAMVLGTPAGLAAAADLLSLAALPLVAARAALAALLRWQLAAMRAMWRLLRGRGLPFRPWSAPGCAARFAITHIQTEAAALKWQGEVSG